MKYNDNIVKNHTLQIVSKIKTGVVTVVVVVVVVEKKGLPVDYFFPQRIFELFSSSMIMMQ